MPESYVIFTGRPNAGKSSIIRALTGLKLPRGKRPGTTTKISKFESTKNLYLVDMPGYGIKIDASRKWVDEIKDKILDFIDENANNIVASVHVLNIMTFIETQERLAKKGFINIDVELVHYLKEKTGEYPLIAANKIDKGKKHEIFKNLEALIKSLTDERSDFAINYIFQVSAKKSIGIGELKNELVSKIQKAGFRNPFEYIR
jgi:GTP-binding protein EngB required for normal cell division